MDGLEPGDFLYQHDQELFLVCIGETEDEYEFAVHGWRTIDKDRLDDYVSADRPIVHEEDVVENVVAKADDPKASEKLAWLRNIFSTYEEKDIPDESHKDDFALKDT